MKVIVKLGNNKLTAYDTVDAIKYHGHIAELIFLYPDGHTHSKTISKASVVGIQGERWIKMKEKT